MLSRCLPYVLSRPTQCSVLADTMLSPITPNSRSHVANLRRCGPNLRRQRAMQGFSDMFYFASGAGASTGESRDCACKLEPIRPTSRVYLTSIVKTTLKIHCFMPLPVVYVIKHFLQLSQSHLHNQFNSPLQFAHSWTVHLDFPDVSCEMQIKI